MKKLNPEFLESIIEQVNKSPYYKLTSMELAWGECRMNLPVLEKHHQR
jgi:hypothetical protein